MGAGQSDANGGFRIFKVSRNSPAERAGLEVFFDYIVEIDDLQVIHASEESQRSFFEKVQQCVNQQIKLVVYNVRTKRFRDVYVTPAKWGGTGLLGATVRYDIFESASTQGVRVLDVFTNSPAASAGLVPYSDFILGTADIAFKDLDELIESVSGHIGRQLSLHVYNSETETLREVLIMPTWEWGGKGCLGCDIGVGFIHRVPRSRHAPTEQSPEKSQQQRGGAKAAYETRPATHHHVTPPYNTQEQQRRQEPAGPPHHYQQRPPVYPPSYPPPSQSAYVSSAVPPGGATGAMMMGMESREQPMESRDSWTGGEQQQHYQPCVHTANTATSYPGMFSTQQHGGSPQPSPCSPCYPVPLNTSSAVHTDTVYSSTGHPQQQVVPPNTTTPLSPPQIAHPLSSRPNTTTSSPTTSETANNHNHNNHNHNNHNHNISSPNPGGKSRQLSSSDSSRQEDEEGRSKNVSSLFNPSESQPPTTGFGSYTLGAPVDVYPHGNQSSVMTVIPGPPRPGVFYPSPNFAS
eukprot:GHVS01061907.1.p1 GENE.GHVS01061907.1~~GHVS01061907.1.p1  ORF type:complete len:519 (+),score=97.14 GHVS01061907.1:233-1789(+)